MSASKVGQVSLQELQGIVGDEHARQASAEDAVDGVQPSFVVEPGSTEEAAEVLRLASRAGLAVIPRGAGTKLHWGNPPARFDLVVSTVRLNRLLEHAAGDLVARVEAGAPLARVQSELAGAGQRLALDPPEIGATVGGIVAANASGPLRHRFGTARDLLIGITYVLPNGTVARAGGKVVKNVAGYDLAKLFTGSFGTLGLLVETIFRLHPLPAASRTVVLRPRAAGADTPLEELGAAVQAILHSSLVPSALEFSWDGEGVLVALFEGIEPGVKGQAEKAIELLRPHGSARILDEHEQRHPGGTRWDTEYRQGLVPSSDDEETVTLKISTVPNDLPRVLHHLLSFDGRHGARCHVRGHAGTGITYADLSGEQDVLVEMVRDTRQLALRLGGSAVIRRAPVEVKRAADVWGPVGDALPLMRRVKDQFDPDGIMSPGRFVGGI